MYKKQLFDKLLELRNSDSKQYWKMLKSLKHEDSGKNIELQANFTDLMNHFKSQGETPYFDKEFKDKIEFEVSGDINLSVNEVTDKPFSASEIGKCIRRLKTGKSTGPDLISNEIIKFSSAVTCKAITKLFNLILDSGKYPSSWRKSFIILIHKSGDKLNMNNYRGISLQNCIAKLFSTALNFRLIEFYEDKFAIEQFGFRVNHRTTDSIFILKSLITKYLTKKKSKIYACFVDLRRAFDTVWHEGLLYKLKESKIGKKMFDIIKDMYSCCQSAVKLDNEYSEFFEINKGVKQGDSLSPTLFNCFINDLHSLFKTCDPLSLINTSVGSLSFADDLVILSETKTGH